MNKTSNPVVILIIMSVVAIFAVFLAVKQFFILRDRIYQEAYYGIN